MHSCAVGQWFQSESGLHQNWMRDYDPTTGRYLQADPLGLVDSASVYSYVSQNPGRYIDRRGLAQGDRGDFDKNRNRSFDDPYALGAGSLFGGLLNCLGGYCFDWNNQAVQGFSEMLNNDPELLSCIQEALFEAAGDNWQYLGGRWAATSATGATVSFFGGKGASFLAKLGISGGTSINVGLMAGVGDLNYHLSEVGSNPMSAAMMFWFGEDQYDQESLLCECQRKIEEYENLIPHNPIPANPLSGVFP